MKRSNKAVSETVGTLMLLGISVSLFSVLYVSVITIYPNSSSPSVNLLCSIEGNNIIIEHRGGKTLDLNTKFIVTINGTDEKFSVYDYLNNKFKENGVWNVGEQVVYPVGNIIGKKVSLSVIDVNSNSVIVMVDLQRWVISKMYYMFKDMNVRDVIIQIEDD